MTTTTTIPEVIDKFNKQARERGWKATTTLTAWGQLCGLLHRPDLIRDDRWVGKDWDPRLSEHTRTLKKEVARAYDMDKDHDAPVTTEQVTRIVQDLKEVHKEAAVAVVLMWTLVARSGDVLQLRTRNVHIHGQRIKVLYTAGKTVMLTQKPYVVASFLGPWAIFMALWLTTRKGHTFLFPIENRESITKAILKAVKKIHPDLNTRAFRRGAAITLAQAGIPIRDIRQFTGHATDEMCARYLGWGWHAHEKVDKGQEQGKNLWK